MVTQIFVDVVLFAVIAGVIASVFTGLSWYVFQQTSVRYVFASLTALALIGTLYHVLLLVDRQHAIGGVGTANVSLEVVRSAMYTIVAAVILICVYFNRRVDRNLNH